MNRTERRMIMKRLEEEGEFPLDEYTRIYPDNPQSTASGQFIIKARQRVYYPEGNWAEGVFDIVAREQLTEDRDFELDCHKANFWFKNEKSRKDFWDEVRAFLDRFESLEQLKKHVKNQFNFETQKQLLGIFEMLQSELEDGTEFEDFLERVI